MSVELKGRVKMVERLFLGDVEITLGESLDTTFRLTLKQFRNLGSPNVGEELVVTLAKRKEGENEV